jgi:photosystem II Psb27 protein
MKRYLSRLFALVCVVMIGLTGLPGLAAADSLTGNYKEDVLMVIQTLKVAIDLPTDAPNKTEVRTATKQQINDFASRYRRNATVLKLNSFTTMRTALNSLAGHYSSYPNRPVPAKLKTRLLDEFKQVEVAINRGA